jgi:MFS family permease
MVFGVPRALFPALANKFGGGASIVGGLYAAPYAGALLASLLSGWMGHVRRQGLVVAVAAALWGVAIAAFGFAGSLWLALLLLAAAGAADNVSAVMRQTILFSVTPDRLRGRLSGIEFAQVASTPALGNVEAGLVASLTSLRFSIVSGGIACVAGTLLIALLVPAFIRYDAREALDAAPT